MNLRSLLTLGMFAVAVAVSSLPAAAQIIYGAPAPEPRQYRAWQPGWDQGRFDRGHVILGTVSNFKPFRLQIARENGTVETIDLKRGTAILPTGGTPSINQRVAVIGYYSGGTFIANRVILRD